MKQGSKLLSALAALLTLAFSLSAGLALPMLWRGWYYGQIDLLALPARTGWSPAVITEAFDQVMDFLLFDAPFGTGQLKWSASGMAHFADCKFLFRLDLSVFAMTGVLMVSFLLALLFFPGFRKRFSFSPPLAALLVTAVIFLALTVWALADFEQLFTVFHHICFPGKDNWIFDDRTDQIILVLPEEFWAWTAALVGAATLALEGVFSLCWAVGRRLSRPRTIYEELRSLPR